MTETARERDGVLVFLVCKNKTKKMYATFELIFIKLENKTRRYLHHKKCIIKKIIAKKIMAIIIIIIK